MALSCLRAAAPFPRLAEGVAVGREHFIAYIPNKEPWKPARDQSSSPEAVTAYCPTRTFKASSSLPPHMRPGQAKAQDSRTTLFTRRLQLLHFLHIEPEMDYVRFGGWEGGRVVSQQAGLRLYFAHIWDNLLFWRRLFLSKKSFGHE